MLFTQFRFVAFFAIVWSIHWSLRSHRLRKLWLLLASYAFYAAWDWRFLSLILASTVIDYAAGRRMGAAPVPFDADAPPRRPTAGRGRRGWLILSLVANLGLLGVFKYFDFFAASAAEMLLALGLPASDVTLRLVLPVGISFYTFQTLSYSIDVYRGRLQPISSLADFALFVAFFPQLVAGPIVRAVDFLPQLTRPTPLASVRFRACALLFLVGFVKKACVADNVAAAVDLVFADPAAFGAADHWLAAVLYTIQIYCDFSGYSDMAIACGGLLGYRLPLNFDFPYLAGSISEFWRRWHISLSSWFRDYLYIPLGGSRFSAAHTYRNLVIVFLLCGLWHGANWTFVVWGLFHGGVLLLERMGGWRVLERLPDAVRCGYVVLVALLSWVIFRAESVDAAFGYLAGMFVDGAAGTEPLWAGWWGIAVGFAVVHVLMYRDAVVSRVLALPPWLFALLWGAAMAGALPWMASGYTPFIYFQF